MRSWKKKTLWALLVVMLAALATLLLLPVWFPWALGPLARYFGVTYRSRETLGFNRIALHEVQARFGDFGIQARRVELPLPQRWFWERFFSATVTNNLVWVDQWTLAEQPRTSIVPNKIHSAAALLDIIDTLGPKLKRWMPAARFTKGCVLPHTNGFFVPEAVWRDGILTATIQSSFISDSVTIDCIVSKPGELILLTMLTPSSIRGRHVFKRRESEWNLDSHIDLQTNDVVVTALFGYDSWWPDSAQFSARNLNISSKLMRSAGYRGITANLEFHWKTNRFDFTAHASAEPQNTNSIGTPPFELTTKARGDLDSLRVDKLIVATPYARGELEFPFTFNWRQSLLDKPVTFKLDVNLSQTAIPDISGALAGVLLIRPDPLKYAAAQITLQGSQVSVFGLTTKDVVIQSRLDWPELSLEQATVNFNDASSARVEARLDLQTGVIANGIWNYEGDFLRTLMPSGVTYSHLQTTGQFGGPLNKLAHAGIVRVQGLRLPGLKPCTAGLDWLGESLVISKFSLDLARADNRLQAGGAMQLKILPEMEAKITLEKLDWRQNGTRLYTLDQPCSLVFSQPQEFTPDAAWIARVDSFHWQGPSKDMKLSCDIHWPLRGQARFQTRQFAASDFVGLIDVPEMDLHLDQMDFAAHWQGGPVEYELGLAGRISQNSAPPIAMNGRMFGSNNGLDFDSVSCQIGAWPPLVLNGRSPFLLALDKSGLRIKWSEHTPFQLTLTNAPMFQMIQTMGNSGEMLIKEPELTIHLEGHASQLLGVARLRCRQVEWLPGIANSVLPRLSDLNLEARMDSRRIHIEHGSVQLDGHPVAVTGELPLDPDAWINLVERNILPDWRALHGRLNIADAPLAVFAKYLPIQMQPVGRLSLQLESKSGGGLDGFLIVTNAATQPLPSMGPIRDMAAFVTLHGRHVKLVSLTGVAGGSPVKASGQFDLRDRNQPVFDVKVTGTNVALMRKQGAILRSDLNLNLASSTNREVVLSGRMDLRDALFLKDLKILAPALGSKPSQRPPYFALQKTPFSEWKLDVLVSGKDFLYIRTPIFTGTASAGLRLQGTLEDPVMLGELRLEYGRLTFPFGTLRVDNGLVLLSSDAPHRPRLLVNASGDVYGYAVKLELSGYADEPQLLFSSSPPLSSSQILILLSAGELPNNAGYFSNRDRAGRIALFFGADFVSRLLGGESVQERLNISSGQAISISGKSTYSIEYRLSDRWSLIGEYDRFDMLNANVKWKIYSK